MIKKKTWLVALLLLICLSFTVSGSAAPTVTVHSVWSQKPLSLTDPSAGNFTPTSGDAVVSWTVAPLSSGNKAFYDTIVYANGTRYEFRLVSLGSVTDDEITGKFDIYKNNVLVTTVGGKLYGLSQPVGGYYKFYDNAFAWHVSGYITNRLDF